MSAGPTAGDAPAPGLRGVDAPGSPAAVVDGMRPASVPAELAAAWELLERGDVRAVVADVDGAVLWSARPAAERHRALAERLRADGDLHVAFTPEAFAVLRARAGERAAPGALLADVWADVPEWCHPGRTRAELVDRELALIAEDTVPDPDVALLLTAAAAARLPIAAVSHGPLSADQVRRRLEHPALDAVTWRDVALAGPDPAEDPIARAAPAAGGDERPLLVLTTRPVPETDGVRVVALGTPGAAGDVAVRRIADRLRGAAEAQAVPAPLRPAWLEGATVLGPVLCGFAEWSVRHAAGHPGGALLCLAEPGALLPQLLAEVAAARGLGDRIDVVPLTAELLVAGAADDAFRAELRDRLAAGPDGPLTLCHVGGSGVVQTRLAELLRAAGTPRHVVGFHLLSDATAADAALGGAGGEVHGYLANLGVPAPAHERAARWRPRLERVAGAPDRARSTLHDVLDRPEDRDELAVEAARRGVLAFLRQHLRVRATTGPAADLLEAGPWLATGLPELPTPPAPAVPADALLAPAWVAPTVDGLAHELAVARAEVARRDAVVASRPYRLVLALRSVVARLRAR